MERHNPPRASAGGLVSRSVTKLHRSVDWNPQTRGFRNSERKEGMLTQHWRGIGARAERPYRTLRTGSPNRTGPAGRQKSATGSRARPGGAYPLAARQRANGQAATRNGGVIGWRCLLGLRNCWRDRIGAGGSIAVESPPERFGLTQIIR